MEILRHHIQKHHRKYLFASGAAAGRALFKIMTILAMFLTLWAWAENANTPAEKITIHQAIAAFDKVDNRIHQEIDQGWSNLTENTLQEFNTIDTEFHTTRDINEQIQAIKKYMDFLTKQDVGHDNLTEIVGLLNKIK